ncbi:hypothetical protein [Aeromicrobium sp. UC242_57]|uniref:hypothetical protein n=1 Tax=Aeromicrobium sp. UC242_57 TaxID=3374624 RepID=UPI0037A6BD70
MLQMLVRLPVQVERFSARVTPHDVSNVRGIESVGEPVMCLVVVATVDDARHVERLTKTLNKSASVFKVVATTT